MVILRFSAREQLCVVALFVGLDINTEGYEPVILIAWFYSESPFFAQMPRTISSDSKFPLGRVRMMQSSQARHRGVP
jgi:hypothetical protein